MRALAERDLVRQGLPVVQAVARRIAGRVGGSTSVDDLLGIGHLALLEVARRYDPARSTFAPYAALKLKWAMLDGLRRETHGRSASARLLAVIASERHADGAGATDSGGPTTAEEDREALRSFLAGQSTALALGLMAGPPHVDPTQPSAPNPEEQLARAQTVHAARAAVASLPEKERALIDRHYFGGEPFNVIAADLGISKSSASRLHDRAIERLDQILRDQSVDQPLT